MNTKIVVIFLFCLSVLAGCTWGGKDDPRTPGKPSGLDAVVQETGAEMLVLFDQKTNDFVVVDKNGVRVPSCDERKDCFEFNEKGLISESALETRLFKANPICRDFYNKATGSVFQICLP